MHHAENLFLEGAGIVAGASKHITSDDQQLPTVELVSAEALGTSEIKGEYLNRESIQSSIRRELGLKIDHYKATPIEAGVAENDGKTLPNAC